MKHKHGNIFLDELSIHLRYTVFAVILAAIVVAVLKITYFKEGYESQILSEHFFEGFFISHLFFASLTPAALFHIYRRNIIIGIAASVISSALTCSLSDIIFPYLGGLILNYEMHLHICIIEEPLLAWIFIFSGAVIGYLLSVYVRKLSRFTHTIHILLSSVAASLYLISYGVNFLSLKAIFFIPILIVSVLVPCVFNDVGVPSYLVSFRKESISETEFLDSLHSEHHDHHH